MDRLVYVRPRLYSGQGVQDLSIDLRGQQSLRMLLEEGGLQHCRPVQLLQNDHPTGDAPLHVLQGRAIGHILVHATSAADS